MQPAIVPQSPTRTSVGPDLLEDTFTFPNEIVPLSPERFATKWTNGGWNPLPNERLGDTPPPTSLRLVCWNVDFMAPNANIRLQCALDHIRSTLETQATAADAGSLVPCCVLLQETEGDAMPTLLKNKWVREHFTVIPTSVKHWPSPQYGNVTLVSNSVPTASAQSLVFGNSRMGRNALLVDVQLKVPGDDEPALLRIANVHLESLPEGTSKRTEQLSATAELLRAAGVRAGVVAGDMNPIDPRDATIPAEAGLTDAYQGAEDDESNFTWGYQPPSRFPACRMDKVLYTGNSSMVVDTPSRLGVGLKTGRGQWVSDHHGLMTTVRFCED